jgi:hypothetical protein
MPHLKLAGSRRSEQSPLSIPIRPLKIIEQRQFTAGFEGILHSQAVDRLLRPEFSACMPGALDAEQSMTARLPLVHASVSTLVPHVTRIARRTVRRFYPTASPLGGELHGRNRL